MVAEQARSFTAGLAQLSLHFYQLITMCDAFYQLTRLSVNYLVRLVTSGISSIQSLSLSHILLTLRLNFA